MNPDDPTPDLTGDCRYAHALQKLAETRPRLANKLLDAERRRGERLTAYLPGARLRGLERLFQYMDRAQTGYAADADLARIAFLLTRAASDYETAIEAALSGYQGVAADAMRDVMEIEYLLLDFVADPNHVTEWLTSDSKTRLRKFGPGALRRRIRAAGLSPSIDEKGHSVDYAAHSEALHVTPVGHILAPRGIEPLPDDAIRADAAFMELFEHGRRLIKAIELLRVTLYILRSGGTPDRFELFLTLDDFFEAYGRTKEMQVMLVALLEAPRTLAKQLGREPSTAEILAYIRDAAATKSPRRPKSL